jgi:hypothetical protein
MNPQKTNLTGIALWMALLPAARAQNQPQQIVQQAVDAEHTADRGDRSQWLYLETIAKPGGRIVQWVATTSNANIDRVLEKNGTQLPEEEQRTLVQRFLGDAKAQKKQMEESNHDNQQIDDLLVLLPAAFVWTQTAATETTTTLHFEPAPGFHPPTREARVFSGMTGDLVLDNRQHRICKIDGRLTRDITFGGGLLGKLRAGSSFSLEQQQTGPSLWQLTEIHVHLQGTALLFKSVSLEEDDERTRFQPESSSITLDQAADNALRQPPQGLR